MEHITNKASYNLSKLNKFRSAPPNIKLILYKTLIRPIMEYPAILLSDSSITRINKLQVIQNKALRFIYNTHWTEHITNNTLHNRANLETVKVRLNKLKIKSIKRAYETITDEQGGNAVYVFSDYVIEEEPFFPPSNKLKNLYEKMNMLEILRDMSQ